MDENKQENKTNIRCKVWKLDDSLFIRIPRQNTGIGLSIELRDNNNNDVLIIGDTNMIFDALPKDVIITR